SAAGSAWGNLSGRAGHGDIVRADRGDRYGREPARHRRQGDLRLPVCGAELCAGDWTVAMLFRGSSGGLETEKPLRRGSGLSVVVCSENRRADWDDLIAQCADATSGHLWQWRQVVGSAYGFDSFYLL